MLQKKFTLVNIIILIEIPALMLIVYFFRKNRESFPSLCLDIDKVVGELKLSLTSGEVKLVK